MGGTIAPGEVERDGGVIEGVQGEPTDVTESYEAKEYTLAGAGQAMAHRVLIDDPKLDGITPSDEDTTMVLDRSGRVIDARSWFGGELHISPLPAETTGAVSIVGQLREAYRARLLKPSGDTADGALRLTGRLAYTCGRTSVVLDASTFIPRRIDAVTTDGDGDPGETPSCEHAQTDGRIVMRVTAARYLPATRENRSLLQLSDWPTDRIVGPNGESLDTAPPVPPLEEN